MLQERCVARGWRPSFEPTIARDRADICMQAIGQPLTGLFHPGDDGRLAEAAGRYADGLVIAGMGGGHVPPAAAVVLAELARRMLVVLASRCAAWPVLTSTYRGVGAESDLIAQGLLPVGNLQPLKARLRLVVGLSLIHI